MALLSGAWSLQDNWSQMSDKISGDRRSIQNLWSPFCFRLFYCLSCLCFAVEPNGIIVGFDIRFVKSVTVACVEHFEPYGEE